MLQAPAVVAAQFRSDSRAQAAEEPGRWAQAPKAPATDQPAVRAPAGPGRRVAQAEGQPRRQPAEPSVRRLPHRERPQRRACRWGGRGQENRQREPCCSPPATTPSKLPTSSGLPLLGKAGRAENIGKRKVTRPQLLQGKSAGERMRLEVRPYDPALRRHRGRLPAKSIAERFQDQHELHASLDVEIGLQAALQQLQNSVGAEPIGQLL